MNILVIDGQGGKLGKQLVEAINKRVKGANIIAVGTNSVATATMLKAGAVEGATGENPVIVGCRTADVIIGPIGIVVADALLGEVTPKMAMAVGQSKATRILVPMNMCDNIVAGVSDISLNTIIDDAITKIEKLYT
ncbi:MAG: DUF3842 family protein [Anaerovoracaceae bacterium]